MKQWMTAAEIAALRLPELPSTERGLRKAADRAKWPWRTREASGGGREYPISALPVAARAAYGARHLAAHELPAPVAMLAAEEPEAATLTADAAENRDARLALLAAADRYAREHALSRKRADVVFATAYNLGQMAVASWIRGAVTSITPRTLARWRAAREAGATHRLAVDKGAARRGRGILETANGGAVKAFILGLISKNPLFTADHVRDAVGAKFGDLVAGSGEVVELPPLRTFQAALKHWRTVHKVDLTALTDPDGFRNKCRHSGTGSMAHIRRPNELWQIDASPADMLCVDGRYSVYVALDLFTRRMIVSVSRTPRASAVGLLLRRAILKWGVPEAVKTDNGSDFVAMYTQRVFAALGIRHVISDPFAPQQKGHVERAIGTFQRNCVRLMPGFIGHSVADRKTIEARKSFAERLGEDPREALCVEMTADELQHAADAWVASKYEQQPHAGLGGATPAQVAAQSTVPVKSVDMRALDMLLAPVAEHGGRRTVTKFGIRVANHHYRTPTILPATEVLVRMDPADMGIVFLFDPSGAEYLGIGECPELLGTDPKDATAATREAHARLMAERTADARREAKALTKGPRLIDQINRYNASKAGKLVELPRPREIHTTPQLDAAAEAVAPVQAPSVSEDARALRAKFAADMAAVVPLRAEETPRQRYNRACALEQRLARSETLTADETRFLVGYVRDPEYRAFRETFGDPGVGTASSAG